MFIRTQDSINWIIDILQKDQAPDGSWDYAFETGIATDAYMIILLRSLSIDDEHLIEGLARRILNKQEKNGAWKLFHDEDAGDKKFNMGAAIQVSTPIKKFPQNGYFHFFFRITG